MSIFLETERLVLRQFTEADVDNLVELDSDPDVMRYINGGLPTPRDEIQNDILPNWLRYYARWPGLWLLGSDRKVDRRLSGVVPLPAATRRQRRRSRAWLPAAQIGLEQGLRHRRIARADRPGLYRVRGAACRGGDGDRQRRLQTGHGEVRPDVGRHGLAIAAGRVRWTPVAWRRVRAGQGRTGNSSGSHQLVRPQAVRVSTRDDCSGSEIHHTRVPP